MAVLNETAFSCYNGNRVKRLLIKRERCHQKSIIDFAKEVVIASYSSDSQTAK
jgi:hypothetical protein